MKIRHILHFTIIVSIILSSSSSAARILFYEVSTPETYKISSGLSKFAARLSDKGYEMASMTRGELSEDRLAEYDILIIHPGKPLKTEELSAVLWFVLTKGGGVFILGGEPANANQIMSPFGMIMDDGILIDSTDTIPEEQIQNFIVDRFNLVPTSRVTIQGVSQLGFYKGHGLKLSGNSYAIATGDQDTYSDTLSFTSGSMPPIAGAAIFGNGLVFTLSDIDMLTDKYIDKYDNLQFGLNIVDWLSITVIPTTENVSNPEVEILIGELKLEKLRLEQQIDQFKAQIKVLEGENMLLTQEVASVNEELETIQKGKIGPFTRSNWAVIILGVCIFGGAIVASKRWKKKGDEGEELLGELGYEFEEPEKKEGAAEEPALEEEELDKELGEL
ncbi:MAG: hypothetical protein V1921_02735 [Candidatus Altiarchaeota archaeon]